MFVDVVGFLNVDGRENLILLFDSWRGCFSVVAIICLRGVVICGGCGRGLMICCRLFLLEGVGVGGKGVGVGEGVSI